MTETVLFTCGAAMPRPATLWSQAPRAAGRLGPLAVYRINRTVVVSTIKRRSVIERKATGR